MEILKIKESEILFEFQKSIQQSLHRVIYGIFNSQSITVNSKEQVDQKQCKNMSYEVYPAYYNGGTIVFNKGDFAFSHFGEVGNKWAENFIPFFIKWLAQYGVQAIVSENDFLVDGYKVGSLCITRHGNIDQTAGFVGINTQLNDIKTICKKPMVKIPKGLSEYGITTAEVEAMFLKFTEKYCKDMEKETEIS